jgi:hypothetical protein
VMQPGVAGQVIGDLAFWNCCRSRMRRPRSDCRPSRDVRV